MYKKLKFYLTDKWYLQKSDCDLENAEKFSDFLKYKRIT